MKIMKIFVDKLPKNCKNCKFYMQERNSDFPYRITRKFCFIYNTKTLIHTTSKDRAEFCPLRELKIDGEKR